VARLDRLLANDRRAASAGAELEPCLARVEARRLCPTLPGPPRVFSLHLGLDPVYADHWPDAQGRLRQTLTCVNRLYQGTGVQWEIAKITAWDPGAQRHQLEPLLRRIEEELPVDGKSLRLGLTVWAERRVYATAGGAIGLSRPGRGSCVVPSWPRIENDCLTIAHELGHLLGAKHVPGKSWIMSWSGYTYHLPVSDPVARVVSVYRFHPRNLEAIRAHRRAHLTRHGLALPVDCMQRLRLVDRCWRL
jgi:hypothetical protein